MYIAVGMVLTAIFGMEDKLWRIEELYGLYLTV